MLCNLSQLSQQFKLALIQFIQFKHSMIQFKHSGSFLLFDDSMTQFRQLMIRSTVQTLRIFLTVRWLFKVLWISPESYKSSSQNTSVPRQFIQLVLIFKVNVRTQHAPQQQEPSKHSQKITSEILVCEVPPVPGCMVENLNPPFVCHLLSCCKRWSVARSNDSRSIAILNLRC